MYINTTPFKVKIQPMNKGKIGIFNLMLSSQ